MLLAPAAMLRLSGVCTRGVVEQILKVAQAISTAGQSSSSRPCGYP
jgi:hypothetical protein